MDALDEATLRKRRDRLLNPITAPFIFLREAMFTYAPPPPIPPPFVFGAMPHAVAPSVPPAGPPDDLTGVKRDDWPEPEYGDDTTVPDDARQRIEGPEADEAVNRLAAHKRPAELLSRQERLDRARQRTQE